MLPRFFLATLLLATAVPRIATANPTHQQNGQRSNTESSWKALGLVSGGTGLMFLAGAAAYKSAADSDERAANAGLEIDLRRERRGEERAQTALVLGVVGATALVGGVVSYYVGGRKPAKDPKAVLVTPIVVPTAGRGTYSGFAISAKF